MNIKDKAFGIGCVSTTVQLVLPVVLYTVYSFTVANDHVLRIVQRHSLLASYINWVCMSLYIYAMRVGFVNAEL